MGTVPRGQYKNGVRTRAGALHSALAVFAQYGYSGSLRQIAERVGVTPAALGRHFGKKHELLLAVLEYWGTQVDVEIPQRSGIEYFHRLRDVMSYHVRNRGQIELFITIAAEATNIHHPAHRFMVERFEKLILEAVGHLERAEQNGDIRNFTRDERITEARMVFALMDGLELQWLLNPTINLEETFNAHLDCIVMRWLP